MGENMQNNDDYITIAEFTRSAGISPAAVYKRINNQDTELLTYVKTVNNKKYIKKDAITLFNVPNKEPIINTVDNANNVNNQINAEVNKQLKPIYEENLNTLKAELENRNQQITKRDEQIDGYISQIAKKDAQIDAYIIQIAELNNHLADQSKRVQESLYVAAAKQIEPEPVPKQEQQPEQKPPKKGFWGWVKKHLD